MRWDKQHSYRIEQKSHFIDPKTEKKMPLHLNNKTQQLLSSCCNPPKNMIFFYKFKSSLQLSSMLKMA